MAAVVSTGRGHDASCPFKTTGAAKGPVITGQCRAGNFLSAVQKGGEPAGTRRFGFEWAYQPASKGRVITGFPEKAMDRVLLPPGADHQDRARARRPVWERQWARAG